MSIGKVTAIATEADFSLWVTWDDGFGARLNLSPLLEERQTLRPLLNVDMFQKAALSADGWSVEWPCGIDFGAPQLRYWAEQGFRAAA
jgi:hypothetical protein